MFKSKKGATGGYELKYLNKNTGIIVGLDRQDNLVLTKTTGWWLNKKTEQLTLSSANIGRQDFYLLIKGLGFDAGDRISVITAFWLSLNTLKLGIGSGETVGDDLAPRVRKSSEQDQKTVGKIVEVSDNINLIFEVGARRQPPGPPPRPAISEGPRAASKPVPKEKANLGLKSPKPGSH